MDIPETLATLGIFGGIQNKATTIKKENTTRKAKKMRNTCPIKNQG